MNACKAEIHGICWLCEQKCPTNGILQHLKNIHDYNVLNCEDCDFMSLRNTELLQHKNSCSSKSHQMPISKKRKRSYEENEPRPMQENCNQMSSANHGTIFFLFFSTDIDDDLDDLDFKAYKMRKKLVRLQICLENG